MFHSLESYNKINLLYERTPRMIYNDQVLPFQELLDKDNSFTIHHVNIQSLAIEMFKAINNIAATTIDDFFTTYHSYSLRSNLSLFFQVCVQFITIKLLYSITVSLSGI